MNKRGFLDSMLSGAKKPKDVSVEIPSTVELSEMMEFLDRQLAAHYAGITEANLKIRELSGRLGVLERELAQISGPQRKLKRSIIIELEISRRGTLELSVSYMARGASWHPVYDARASFDSSAVELISYGIVKQQTGEDWQDVNITLSTARPAARGQMPDVAPWILRPYQPPAVARKRAEHMALEASVRLGYDDEDAQEAVYADARERGTAINYELTRKSMIKSDGGEHKLPVFSQPLEAKFEYSTYPARDPGAYLGSTVVNADNLQLLPGRVNIFMEGDFAGVSSIGGISPGEEFSLGLGLDENVKVSRMLLEKKVDET